jgi:hypothetical protein
MKHTPGPWHVHMGHLIKCEVGLVIADVERNPSHIIKAARVANAHLIAAAPKMLAALEKAAEFIRDEYECLDPLTGTYVADTAGPIWAILSEAIAEARAGESDTQ